MATIFLIRHGEVAGNVGRLTFAGWNDVLLTQRGKEQAHALSTYLQHEELSAIYSSDLKRARDTASMLAASHGLKVQESAVWRELDFGDWNGCGERELLANWPDLWAQRKANPLDVRAPGGENLRDLQARMKPAWQTLVRKYRDGDGKIALVTHQNMIRVIICEILDAPLHSYRALNVGNASVTRVEIGARIALQSVNEVAHLSAFK